jgi:hypothetical protein
MLLALMLLFCSSPATAEQRPAQLASSTASPQYLGFETCGGLTNQRLALLQGLLIAKASNRTVQGCCCCVKLCVDVIMMWGSV